MFLKLPIEIRLLVYEHIFRSTTVRHGFSDSTSNHSSIYRTCREIYNEAQSLFLPNVTFHFSGSEAMLDTLFTFCRPQLEQLKHVQVRSSACLTLREVPEHPSTVTSRVSDMLGLFPGLHLDLLVVEDHSYGNPFHKDSCDVFKYFEVSELLCTDGWRRLEFVSSSAGFLPEVREGKLLGWAGLSPPWPGEMIKSLQPAMWNKVIQDKDGVGSDAKAVIYVAKEQHVNGTTKNPQFCDIFTADMDEFFTGPPKKEDAGNDQEVILSHNEVRVVVQRGNGLGLVHAGSSVPSKIRNLFDSMTWTEIKKNGFLKFLTAEECGLHPWLCD